MSSLTSDQVALQLEQLDGWQLDGNSLIKTFEFQEYADVVAFMTRAAFYCQELEHYPLYEQYYTTLKVRIGDVDQFEIHGRDVQLAKRLQVTFERACSSR